MSNSMADDGPSDEELKPYAGRWVAFIGQKVISQGGTPRQALLAAKASRFKETPDVAYIPTEKPLIYVPSLEPIISALPKDITIYLVGGAVRDALLHQEIHDVDFIVPDDGLKVGQFVASRLNAAFYALDEERKTGRVILRKSDRQNFSIDFTVLQGPDLESDLGSRDFTINAIAVDINQPQALLDPLSGAFDLHAHQLRACSPDAFIADPIRIIRGVRLAAALDLRLLPPTRELMGQAVPLIPQTSIERMRDEFFRILDEPQVSKSIRALDYLDAIHYFLPELLTLKEVNQSPPHNDDVWHHTLKTVDCMRVIIAACLPNDGVAPNDDSFLSEVSSRLSVFRDMLAIHVGTSVNIERSLITLYNLAALYHDIGKPEAQEIDDKGNTHFYEHEKLGTRIISYRAKVLRLSSAEISRLKNIIRNHMRPLLLAQDRQKLSRRAIYRFFRDTGPAGVDICLLSMADTLATFNLSPPNKKWSDLLEVIFTLFDAWFHQPSKIVSPPPLITGSDLMKEFNLESGPLIGKLLEVVRESQAEGLIQTRKEAIYIAHLHLRNTKQK